MTKVHESHSLKLIFIPSSLGRVSMDEPRADLRSGPLWSEYQFFPGQEADVGTPSSPSLQPRDWQLINCSVRHLENKVMTSFAIISYGKLLLKCFSKISTFPEIPPSVIKGTCLSY